MDTLCAPSPYALCYGNEEEGSITRLERGALAESDFGAERLRSGLRAYRNANTDVVCFGEFDSAGRRLYIDGEHPEVATPECENTTGTAARIRNNEQVFAGIAAGLIKTDVSPRPAGRNEEGETTLVVHRRVEDGKGHSIGCHDNYGLEYSDSEEWDAYESQLHPILIGHLVTRSFVTGAGCIKGKHLLFAQKMQRIDCVTGHARKSTLFDVRYAARRIEVRCNDINISDWATRVRLGSTAIALAIARTPLGKGFSDLDLPDLESVQRIAERFNTSPLEGDGTFNRRNDLEQAVDFQLKLAETFLSDQMEAYGARPKDLLWVAKELREYCLDMKRVMCGDAKFTILADRADWAAKGRVMLGRMRRDEAQDEAKRRKGETSKREKRYLGDEACRRDDLAYDSIFITQNAKGRVTVNKAGYGYVLRDRKHAFRATISPQTVRRAATRPPQRTRAGLRSRILRNHKLRSCFWDSISVETKEGNKTISISLDDVRQTKLPSRKAALLATTGAPRT